MIYSIYSIKFYLFIYFLALWQERGKHPGAEKGFSENFEQLYYVM